MRRIKPFVGRTWRWEGTTRIGEELGKIPEPVRAVTHGGARSPIAVVLEEAKRPESSRIAERGERHCFAGLLVAAEPDVARDLAVRLAVTHFAGTTMVASHEGDVLAVEQVIRGSFHAMAPQIAKHPPPEDGTFVVYHRDQGSFIGALRGSRQGVCEVVRGNNLKGGAVADCVPHHTFHFGVLGIADHVGPAECGDRDGVDIGDRDADSVQGIAGGLNKPTVILPPCDALLADGENRSSVHDDGNVAIGGVLAVGASREVHAEYYFRHDGRSATTIKEPGTFSSLA